MSGWKPGGEESPPTGRGLEKRRVIMREASPLSNIVSFANNEHFQQKMYLGPGGNENDPGGGD